MRELASGVGKYIPNWLAQCVCECCVLWSHQKRSWVFFSASILYRELVQTYDYSQEVRPALRTNENARRVPNIYCTFCSASGAVGMA